MEVNSNVAVSIKKLGFTYPGQPEKCFSNLNLEIQEGERFGLFGPNGAGKTTLIHCMIGLLYINEGSIHLFGNNVPGNKKTINRLLGFVPQELSFYQELSPVQNFQFFGAWAGLNA
jgi:ABC-2 type transport system ATP-binding protein